MIDEIMDMERLIIRLKQYTLMDSSTIESHLKKIGKWTRETLIHYASMTGKLPPENSYPLTEIKNARDDIDRMSATAAVGILSVKRGNKKRKKWRLTKKLL